MFLISWNVAGLSTTLRRIQNDYNIQSTQARKKSSKQQQFTQSHAFSYFISRHGSPDVICLQEHKIPLSQLSSRSEMLGASTIEGYESFWSCCIDPSCKGFNGVVTYAKVGTVVSADAAPLGNAELDDQGRCVMTDHGDFVVFNVYVPLGATMSLSYKMKFLNSLRRAIHKQREEGKKVVLVGDLNICHRKEDLHWEYQSVHVNQILKEVRDSKKEKEGEDLSLPKWKLDLESNWQKIISALETMEAVPVTTKNITTGATYEKFRVRVKLSDKNTVFIGHAESIKADALNYFSFPKCTYYDHDLQEECMSRDANIVSIDVLNELMFKIARVKWTINTLRLISTTNASRSSPPVRWLNQILEEDGMVDAFRSLYPNAQGRFTCWSQLSSNRFENKGFRLDYTLLDTYLMAYLERGPSQKLRCSEYPNHKADDEEAALHAATASGAFKGASFDGSGIPIASQKTLDKQFDTPQTGIIYTPPSYSDHVAISLLLNEDFRQLHMSSKLVLDVKDASTKKAQPHKSQTSIFSFFSKDKNIRGAEISQSKAVESSKSTDKDKSHTCRKSALFFQPTQKKESRLKRKLPIAVDVNKVQKKNTIKPKKNSILHHFIPKK